jgi:hypothetical protein
MANYPLSFCLQNNIESDEILGLNYDIINDSILLDNNNNKNHINDESSILDFILGFSTNAMNFITNIIKAKNIQYEIVYKLTETPLSLNFIKKSIQSMEMRRECIEKGYTKAKEFLEILQSGHD